jgi:DNA-binding beta-propeller fold protein YncE
MNNQLQKRMLLRCHLSRWGGICLAIISAQTHGADPLRLEMIAPGTVRATGDDGTTFWLEATSDFEQWELLPHRTIRNGNDTQTDAEASRHSLRFYRALPLVQTTIASNLWSPTKLALTADGSVLVAEAGLNLNNGRISIIDSNGQRRVLLSGLPSGRMPPQNDQSGPSGLVLLGRTLYVSIGAGDATVSAGQGREAINPNPSSPLYSSILKWEFDRAVDSVTETFALTSQQTNSLSQGETVNFVQNSISVSGTVLANFPDAVSDPTVGARPANIFGMTTDGTNLYVANAGMNLLYKVSLADGAHSVLATFPARPNPSSLGPPMLDAVPDDAYYWKGEVLVSFLTGFPFPSQYAQVLAVNPTTGQTSEFIQQVNLAIGIAASQPQASDSALFVLEYSAGSFGSAGQLLRFSSRAGARLSISTTVGNPTGLAVDPVRRFVYVADNANGRVFRIQSP